MSMSRLLTTLGALVLLGAWSYQEFEYDRLNAKLRVIENTYSQAMTTVLASVNYELLQRLSANGPDSSRAYTDSLWYALAEQMFDDALSDSSKRRLWNATPAESIADETDLASDEDAVALLRYYPRMKSLYRLSGALMDDMYDIGQRKRTSQRLYWGLYILGSLLVVLGGVWPTKLRKALADGRTTRTGNNPDY